MNGFSKVSLQDNITNFLNNNFKTEKDRLFLTQNINITRATFDRWRSQSLIPKVESIAKLAILLNKSIDEIIFSEPKNVFFSGISFDNESYKKRISYIITSYQNNSKLSSMLKIAESTIGLWKKEVSSPSLIKLIKFSQTTNNSLDYIILGYK